ncbi:hypothetical protein [Selenomonas ruminantium]|uniref:hypothetical protein n=1 Tax=Selenomonas ruminantium TaxID=971 RepID=UPI00116083E8|nr:hypothetical protein [Selenomonas ruminantium]
MLYYYCCQRYKVTLSTAGIRLVGDKISQEEWGCPVMKARELPNLSGKWQIHTGFHTEVSTPCLSKGLFAGTGG